MKTAQMNELRKIWLETVCNWLEERGEEVLIQNSGCVAFPTTLDGEEGFVRLKIEIPTEKNCDEASGNDPYSIAEEYKMKLEAQAIKKKEAEEKKQKKIEEDKRKREAKAAERAAKLAESKKIVESKS